MARVVAILVAAAAIAMAHSAAAYQKMTPLPVKVLIQNNFRAYNLTVHCDSDLKKYPDVHLLHPREVYNFTFNPKTQHRWIGTEKKDGNLCSKNAYSGKFMMWKINMPLFSHWFADRSGLSLIRPPKTKPALVYNWPMHVENNHG